MAKKSSSTFHEEGLSSTLTNISINLHIHAKTIIVVIAVNFLYFAHLFGVVGSGMLAKPITTYFDDTSVSVWMNSLINIFTVALNPPISQAADYWGRKWFLVILTLSGFVGSIVISRAQSIGVVLVGFSLLSVAYGAQSLLFAVVSEVLPRKHRPTAQASVTVTAGIGAVIGIIAAGALLRNNALRNYRVYYYVEAAIFASAAIGVALFYNPPLRGLQKVLTLSEKLRRLDWIGYFLLSPGLTLLTMALAWSQNPYDWKNVHILALFIIGILLMIAFVIYEWRFRSDGMLHHGLFKNRNFPISMLIVFVEGLAFFTCNAYFAYEVTILCQVDLLAAGLRFSILFFASVVLTIIFAIYSQKLRVVRVPLIIGCACLMIFNILMATVNQSTRETVFWGYPVLVGVGLGSILPTSMVSAQLSTPSELISTTSGLMLTVRSFGGAISLAINTAIFNHDVTTNVPPKVAAAVLPLGLPESSLGSLITALNAADKEAFAHVPGITPEIIRTSASAFKEAYAISFRGVWITAACFTSIAFAG